MHQALSEGTVPRHEAVRTGSSNGWWADLLTAGARDWNLSTGATAFISLALPILVCLFGIATALAGKEAFKWFTREDGVAEDLQVLAWGLALMLSFVVMVRLWKAGAKAFAAMYFLLSVGMVLIVGEELSWGQRIFGWVPSEAMITINRQSETNLHNIRGIEEKVKWFHLLVGAYGTLVPLLLFGLQQRARFTDAASLLVPHYTLVPYFFATLAWRLQASLWKPPKRLSFVVSEYSEVLELVLAIAFFLFLLFQFRKSQTAARAS